MLTPFNQRGVTLIEILISLSIIALLVTLALPQYTAWIQSTQIRTVAEAVQSGLQFARLEAIKRNERVQIVYDADYHAWTIQLSANQTVLRRDEGLTQFDSVTVTPDVAGANMVSFSGLGRISPPIVGETAPFTQLAIDNSAQAPAQSQDLNVTISPSGSVRLCNPNKSAPDPRAC